MSLVDTWKFLSSQLGNSSFSSAHHSTAWSRVMVCGGADQQYTVSRQCWWYSIPHDTWYSAPPMWKPRYGAVAVELSGPSSNSKFLTILQSNNLTNLQSANLTYNLTDKHPGGQIWMTGGRDGSTILKVCRNNKTKRTKDAAHAAASY